MRLSQLRTDTSWMAWNEGRFVATTCEEGVVGVENDLGELRKASLVLYHEGKGQRVTFGKIEGGRIVEVPSKPVSGVH